MLILISTAWLFACSPPSAEPKQARGLIVEVKAGSNTQLDAFELQLAEGSRIMFRVEGDVGITPGHAREHMILAEPVTVTYRDSQGGPLASAVAD